MYLSYGDYQSMGGMLEEAAFNRMEAKAERLIDRATHARLQSSYSVPNSVAYCTYSLISAIQADESLGGAAAGREVSSMSNDGVSVSFSATGGVRASARYMAIIHDWLDGEITEDGVHLLYAGCDA